MVADFQQRYGAPGSATHVDAAALQIAVVDSVEACGILGVTANHLRQLVFRRRLVPVGKRGRRLLFAHGDVEALRKDREHG